MHSYTEKMKAYLAAKTPDYGYSDVHSMLEMLYNCYTTHNPIDSEHIRSLFREQGSILSKLHYHEVDRIFTITNDICAEHERVAFLEGLHVGARLTMELTERE